MANGRCIEDPAIDFPPIAQLPSAYHWARGRMRTGALGLNVRCVPRLAAETRVRSVFDVQLALEQARITPLFFTNFPHAMERWNKLTSKRSRCWLRVCTTALMGDRIVVSLVVCHQQMRADELSTAVQPSRWTTAVCAQRSMHGIG